MPDNRHAKSSPQMRAAALGYQLGRDVAPRVLATGVDDVARAIIENGERYGVPIQRDPDLLQCLAPHHVGEEIPPEAYVAVAEILAFLYTKNAEAINAGMSQREGSGPAR